MAETLGPQTELDAVNEMMAAIGVSAFSSLSSLPPDASIAQSTLYRVSRQFQEAGRYFNTSYEVELSLDGSNNIPLPSNTLRVDAFDEWNHYTFRGDNAGNYLLYNIDDDTFTFSDNVKVNIVYHLEWDRLPPAARHYIVQLAIQDWTASKTIEPAHRQMLDRKLMMAKADWITSEGENSDRSLLSGSESVRSVLARGRGWARGGVVWR